MNTQYHYTDCGLDYVYLANGYEIHETPHGEGVSIKDAKRLHEVIARDIVSSERPIQGQDVRFLRGMLGLSQGDLARLLRQRRGSVTRWESMPDKRIPGPADLALRFIYTAMKDGNETVVKFVNLLVELDDLHYQLHKLRTMILQQSDRNWEIAA